MSHTIHTLTQGSADWHAYRADHRNASEAAAMLGMSSYQTRSQLLHAKATGTVPAVNAATQRRFDAGHEFEALARPWAEAIIGEDLYPITASRTVEGLALSASYDGATLMEDTAFEHKSLNAALVESLSVGLIPEQYHPQLEQQLLIIGAKRVLFMASSGVPEDMLYAWYECNPALRDRLLAGWKQFTRDLAVYVPVAPAAPAAVGHAPDALPALHIEVTGMVTASNLDEYKARALSVIGSISRELTTDQHFADNKKAIVWCSNVEAGLKEVKQKALRQTQTLDELFSAIDAIVAKARDTRLELEKLDVEQAKKIRLDLVVEGEKALATYMAQLNVRLGQPLMPVVQADFAAAIKGKRTVESLHNAVDTALAHAKLAALATADRIQTNLLTIDQLASGLKFLFADLNTIVLKAPDDCQALVQNRIAAHVAEQLRKEEAQRARIRAEEVQRIERELASQAAAAEKAAQETALAHASIDKVAIEEIAAQTPAEPGAPLPDTAVVIPLLRQPDSTASDARAPTLSLGQIGIRLGFGLNAEFLRALGFEPNRDPKRPSAALFHEADFPLICAALVTYIQRVQAKQAA